MSKLSNVYATGNALEIDHQIKQVSSEFLSCIKQLKFHGSQLGFEPNNFNSVKPI